MVKYFYDAFTSKGEVCFGNRAVFIFVVKKYFQNLLFTAFLDSKVQSKGLHIVSQRDKISVMDAANFAKKLGNLAAHANPSTRGS